MCDEWMPLVRVPMPIEAFRQLPTHPAYKYEYVAGTAILTPRPKAFHARLDLARDIPLLDGNPEYDLEPAKPDEPTLPRLFSGAFARSQPFAGLTDDARRAAAAECLRRSFVGEDGPWVAEASFVLRKRDSGDLVGAILVTMLPDGDVSGPDIYDWKAPPPPDLWTTGTGQPHLTWIFVNPWLKGEGIGTRLLAAAADRIRRQGYRHLLSTFILGNDSSMLWHWRNGFELLPALASKRRPRLTT